VNIHELNNECEIESFYSRQVICILADLGLPTRYQKTPGSIALACDAWTSTNKLAFLALVASYIDKDWKLHDVLVDFIELRGSHTSSNLAQTIYESVKGLRIQDQVRDTHMTLHYESLLTARCCRSSQ
jgi:hypothetical protein